MARRFAAPALAFAGLALYLSAVGANAQIEPLRPHSMYEPPAGKVARSLADSSAGVAADLLTTGEKSQWEKTARYQEVIDLARLYEKRSKYIKVVTFGTTPEGRPMTAIIVSKDKAFTPEAAHKTDKAVVLIQSGIHSGEIEGKDTALMLIRDMAVTNHPHQTAWLDKAIFVIIPLFEIDGHEDRSPFNRPQQQGPDITGTRPQEQQLNLNRDYLKADAPEMRAFLKLYNDWLPDFMFDNHVTDGADYQYDVTWDMTQHEDIGPGSRAWVNNRFVPELNKRMEADGHLVSPYGGLRGDFPGTGGAGMANATAARGTIAPPAAGGGDAANRAARSSRASTNGLRDFNVEVFSPRYSHYWSGARNRPCLLVETHSLKTAKTRAWSNYDIMVHSIDIVAEAPQALRKAVRDSDAADAAMAGHKDQQMFLGGKTADTSHPIVYHSLKRVSEVSPITGKPVMHFTAEKDDLTVNMHDGVETTAAAPVPTGFLIPLAWKSIADELALQGVVMERTTKDLGDQTFDTWRFTGAKKQPTPFEGRTFTDYTLQPVTEKMHMPAGSYYVPMNQPRARIIMAMLHPAAPDALVRWGFMDAIFEGFGRIGAGEYLSVPIATRMAADHPELWAEFDNKVKSDSTFAEDADARLRWWISRSSYQPSAANKYPIAEVWTKTW
ncbi:putative carboxypeptidase [Terriglobus roseus DSM 18391]|uniref:Putative carboxypeptidase n=1 Tax=Terriglobus roseus (strain DSM 18391 / NRRL B-41598 / KBS 63) TaxID=926566 RepID=I3ZBQ3_TERRK|nr:M14 family zinc carboxypeptidase [Terriglobus roseus]AFL86671.1 putative carboxypeptidase [Terriglobus roseus DSM 18391]